MSLIGIDSAVGPVKSDEDGYTAMFHFNAALYGSKVPLFGSVLFEGGKGTHTYDGAEQVGLDTINGVVTMFYEPFETEKANRFFYIEGLFGPVFTDGKKLLGIHSGIEFHYWKRSLAGMREIYKWLYIPIGIETGFRLNERLSLGLHFVYRLMVYGGMDIDFGIMNIFYDISAPMVKLGNKHGFKAEIPLQIKVYRWIGIELKPWFEYRPFGRSNIDTITIESMDLVQKSPFLEPASDAYSGGLLFSVMLGKYDTFRKPKAVKKYQGL